MIRTTQTTITLYVPTSVRDAYHVNDYINTLRLISGGMTEQMTDGSWIGDRGVVTEPVKLIRYIVPDYSTRNRAIDSVLENLAAEMHELGEDSVLVEFGETTVAFV